MKSLYIKDIKSRKFLKKVEIKSLWCKSSFLNDIYSFRSKEKIILNFFFISKNIFFSKLKNRCCFSNRGRSVLSNFGISRIKFREVCSFGLLSGIRKGSW